MPHKRSRAAHWRDEVLWSFVGTSVLTGAMRASEAAGQTRIDLPLILGTMMTPDRDRAKVLGTLVHALNGLMFGGIYVAAFHSLRRASGGIGALIGLVHGLVVLIAVLPLLPGVHPRMASDFTGPQPTNALEPPGFMALNYGRRTPIVTLAAHVVYGAILGHFYRVDGNNDGARALLQRDRAPHGDVAALAARDR